MSRKATAEYVGAKRRAYAEAPSAKRRRLLDEVCETTAYSRKYANRLLTGNRKFRERKGRGKTDRGEVLEVLGRVWREAGCPCLPYFKAEAARWVEEYSSEVARVPPDAREALLRMSASTMSRALAGAERVKPGWSKANKHSGRRARNAIKELVPCASGETVMACRVPPGDVQVDTFALAAEIRAAISSGYSTARTAKPSGPCWPRRGTAASTRRSKPCGTSSGISPSRCFPCTRTMAGKSSTTTSPPGSAGGKSLLSFGVQDREKATTTPTSRKRTARRGGNCSAKSASTARTCGKSSNSFATTGRTSATCSVPARCSSPRRNGRPEKDSAAVTTRPRRPSNGFWTKAS